MPNHMPLGRKAGRAGLAPEMAHPWAQTLPLIQAFETWITFLQNAGRSKKYISQLHLFLGKGNKESAYKPVVQFMQDDQKIAYLGQMTAPLIDAWLAQIRENTTQYQYRKGVQLLKRWLRWLVEEGELDTIPIRLKTPRKVESEIKVFTDDEIDRLYKVVRNENLRDHAMFVLMVDTGLRCDELASLTLSQLRFDRGEIELPGDKTKGKSARILTLTESLPLIRRYLHTRPAVKTESVFLSFYATPVYAGGNRRHARRQTGKLPFSEGGITTKGIQQAVRKWGMLAKITDARCSPHTFRHYYAITYLRQGGDVFSLQRLLGHKKLDMTLNYAKMVDVDVRTRQRKYSPALRLTRPRYKPAAGDGSNEYAT